MVHLVVIGQVSVWGCRGVVPVCIGSPTEVRSEVDKTVDNSVWECLEDNAKTRLRELDCPWLILAIGGIPWEDVELSAEGSRDGVALPSALARGEALNSDASATRACAEGERATFGRARGVVDGSGREEVE